MMEIVNIEKDAYEKFAGKFDHFVKKMMEMGKRGSDKRLGEWMDNQEVCDRLRISPRTLQTLRDNGTLAYSQISHKTYYKPEDVESIMRVVADRKKDAMENYLKELITLRTDGLVDAMKSMKEIETLFDKVTYNYRPLLNGERYLSDLEVSHRLKISRRTLQEYRDSGIVPYIKLGGKVLYRESDLEKLLEECYHPAYRKD